MFKDSQDLQDYAEWKGYPHLSYNFNCSIEDKPIVISVSFEKEVLLITIIDPEDHKGNYGFEIRQHISKKIVQKLTDIKKGAK